ncbi:MAG: RluA family pseudouridine synthase [Bacillota bacterium]|nr:RluA family pseudouridine synthase [Bacillota bacterium]
MKEFTINQNDAGQRLDKFITKTVKKLPLTLVYKYLRLKRIKVNGKRADAATRLNEGDTVQMYINDEFFEEKENENAFLKVKPMLDVVYEDENILLVYKKKGLIVHSDDKEDFNTLINHIKAYLYHKGEFDPEKENSFTPALCNRIDKNTEGLVLAAKNAESLRILNEKIKKREIKKSYVCIAHGLFSKKSGTFKNFLLKNERENRVYVYERPVPGAKESITKYQVIREKEDLSLVEVDLVTGRTHQIRAQFANAGHPLLGDAKYGTAEINKPFGDKSQALCAYKIEFKFETEGEILSYLNNKCFKLENPAIFQRFSDIYKN